jgi:molybdate transport system substrate-binding protein
VRRALLALLLLLSTGCGDDEPRTITVFAAASLSKAFAAEGTAFEKSHAGVKVVFSFAGSQSLVAQVEQGAPASVLATADIATIEAVADKLEEEPVVLAQKPQAIVTPKGNPAGVTTLADLARPGLKVVLAKESVPVGKAARRALRKAGIAVTPVSEEDAVTGVVTKVRLDEADAGIAYATDLVGASAVDGTRIEDTTTDLAIALIAGSSDRDDATAFIAFVRSEAGQAILRSFGFT